MGSMSVSRCPACRDNATVERGERGERVGATPSGRAASGRWTVRRRRATAHPAPALYSVDSRV